ncbi:FAD-dependent oxidoreductase [Desulfovibrio aerotolerans]|uniref:FAD-dependent oxidoreductase n=1 Tax=Solidesulfovibrio aerotolerans TaxID=295255 RepID=A0A7C9MWX1_9BACT|nr:NAD(P)/FAD-dependent oxidoreductase [Solidesulfovibrio aerotolerans]MYL84794.1 FAD-dependent oxidoreductase [Solidesulfovibrio aerotolerans]
MKRTCVVIGGGISGMSTAILLAKQGFDVTLVERASRLAPLVRGFSRQGMHFETGFHHTGYLEQGEILDRAFKVMGLTGIESFPLGLGSDQRVVVDGGPTEGYPMSSGFVRLLDVLGDYFPQERSPLQNYLNSVEKTQNSSPYLALDASGPRETPYRDSTLAEVLDSLFTDNRLKSILASQVLYHGVPPAEVSFVFHAWVGAAALRSLRTIKGGGKSLVQAFERALEYAGVRVETGRGVNRVIVSPAGALAGVCLEDGQALETKICVSTVHPALLADLIPEGIFRPAYTNRLARLPETPRAAMVFGMIPTNSDVAPGNSWLFLEGHNPACWFGVEDRRGPGAMSVMISDPGGDNGMASLELAACSAPDVSKYELKEHLIQSYMQRLPSLYQRTQFLEVASPSTFARFTNSPFGSYYGPQHAVGVHPPQPRTRLPGFYLAGQAVVAPGIAGAVISACVAVDVMLGGDTVLKELRQC